MEYSFDFFDRKIQPFLDHIILCIDDNIKNGKRIMIYDITTMVEYLDKNNSFYSNEKILPLLHLIIEHIGNINVTLTDNTKIKIDLNNVYRQKFLNNIKFNEDFKFNDINFGIHEVSSPRLEDNSPCGISFIE